MTKSTIQPPPTVVGFDMDGVIIDHTENKITLAQRFGVILRPDETHSELLARHFRRDDYLALQNELYGNTDLALSAPLMGGALNVLMELRKHGVPFVLISRRRVPENAIALLSRRGLWGEIFNESNAFFVQSPVEKNTVGLREEVSHFFDDERKVLLVMKDIGHRYLFDSFNQFSDEETFPRVHNWEMVRTAIRAGV